MHISLWVMTLCAVLSCPALAATVERRRHQDHQAAHASTTVGVKTESKSKAKGIGLGMGMGLPGVGGMGSLGLGMPGMGMAMGGMGMGMPGVPIPGAPGLVAGGGLVSPPMMHSLTNPITSLGGLGASSLFDINSIGGDSYDFGDLSDINRPTVQNPLEDLTTSLDAPDGDASQNIFTVIQRDQQMLRKMNALVARQTKAVQQSKDALFKLQQLIHTNEGILVRNQESLKDFSMKLLTAVKAYTDHVMLIGTKEAGQTGASPLHAAAAVGAVVPTALFESTQLEESPDVDQASIHDQPRHHRHSARPELEKLRRHTEVHRNDEE